MIVELPALWIALLNILLIPSIHLSLAWLTLRFPQRWFRINHNPVHEPIKIYSHYFFVHRWKKVLPDGAPWVGGDAKSGIKGRSTSELTQFLAECRRGQFAHWLQILGIAMLIVYNPVPANTVIILYAILSNLPCILNLRQTELRLRKILF